MKLLPYIIKYILIMMIGEYIRIIGIPSIYSLPKIVLIPFGFLAIRYGILHQIETKKEIEYKKVKLPLIITTIIINTGIRIFIHLDMISWLILNITTTVSLWIFKSKRERLKEITDKNIKEYFNEKKTHRNDKIL